MIRVLPLIGLATMATACKVDCDEPGTICTVAGTGVPGLGNDGDVARETTLYWPSDVTIAPNGDPWIVDWNNHRIVRLLDGDDGYVVDEITGHGMTGEGPIGAPVSTALWNHPTNLIFRSDDYVVMAGWHTSNVVGLDLANDRVELIAGTGDRAFGGDGGPAVEAIFDLPSGVQYGIDGKLYVSDQANSRIRCIDGEGMISTVVGNGERTFGGDGGPALEASLQAEVSQNADPGGRIAIDGDKMYIADTLNQRVRVVDMVTWTIDTLAGGGFSDPDSSDPRQAVLFWPRDVAVDADGAVYIADSQNHCVRKVDGGVIETVAGICGEFGFYGEGGPATEALLQRPLGLTIGPDGALWIADSWNHVVRRVAP